VRSSAAQAAAIEIDGASSVPTREHDATRESVLAGIEEPELAEEITGILETSEVAVQPRSSGCITDLELGEELGIVDPAAV
jgi:hypothetical protein